MICVTSGSLVLLANQSYWIVLVVGGALVVLGVLRLLRWVPRLTLNVFGRRDKPMAMGLLMILAGGVAVFLALMR